jgi:hypothetical protein
VKKRLLALVALALVSAYSFAEDSLAKILYVGSLAQVKTWMASHSFEPNAPIFADYTALMLVADRYEPTAGVEKIKATMDIYKYLISKGATEDAWSSARTGNLEAVKKALGNQPSLFTYETSGGINLFQAACHSGNLELIRFFYENQADINAPDGWGESPLIHAIRSGSAESVTYLLAHGANPNATSKNGQSPRELANALGYLTIAELFQ